MLTFLLLIALFAAIVGLILQIPMPPAMQNVILTLAIIAVVIWAVQYWGVDTGPIPRLEIWKK